MAGNVKLMTSAGGGVILDTATTTATDVTVKVPAVNGTLVYADGSGNVGVSGNLSFNSGYGSVATAYGCRAWVNFNGTGTVAIRASGNVSSITDNGTGDYTVNFTNAMPDANYSATATCLVPDDGGGTTSVGYYTSGASDSGATYTTTTLRLLVQGSSGTNKDVYINSVAVFR